MYMYIYTLSSDFALFVPIRVPQDPLILRINFALPSSPKTQITNSSYVCGLKCFSFFWKDRQTPTVNSFPSGEGVV